MSHSPASILIVDDDVHVHTVLRRLLEREGYACDSASSAGEARQKLAYSRFELALCDVKMPGGSGLWVVEMALAQNPPTAAVIVTGLDDPLTVDKALELGVYGYVLKPFTPKGVLIVVKNALRRRALELENRAQREALEDTVLARTIELREALRALQQREQDLRHSREETVRRLSRAAEFRDDETGQHTQRVGRYCCLLGKRLGLDDERCELIKLASPLHDVGKIGIPDTILLKPGRLSSDERRVMESHAEIGFQIMSGTADELLDLAASIALTHHEHFDGRGYPRGLSGEEIPLEGRIAAVADAFDALTTERPYQSAVSPEEAARIMLASRGEQFDPQVLDTLLGNLDDLVKLTAHGSEQAAGARDGRTRNAASSWGSSARPPKPAVGAANPSGSF